MSDQYRPPEDMNFMDDNPYRMPSTPVAITPILQLGIVRQVPTLGVLMAVQGGLVCAVGLLLVGVGFMFPFLLEMQAQQPGAVPPPGGVEILMLAVYAGMGMLLLVVGGLTIYSGIRVYRFQSRVMAMVMLGAGFLTIMSCYCLPTAIALAIFGFIVLTKTPVIHAFRIAEGSRMTADEIIAELEKRIRDGVIGL